MFFVPFWCFHSLLRRPTTHSAGGGRAVTRCEWLSTGSGAEIDHDRSGSRRRPGPDAGYGRSAAEPAAAMLSRTVLCGNSPATWSCRIRRAPARTVISPDPGLEAEVVQSQGSVGAALAHRFEADHRPSSRVQARSLWADRFPGSPDAVAVGRHPGRCHRQLPHPGRAGAPFSGQLLHRTPVKRIPYSTLRSSGALGPIRVCGHATAGHPG